MKMYKSLIPRQHPEPQTEPQIENNYWEVGNEENMFVIRNYCMTHINGRDMLDAATCLEEGETFDICGEQTVISQKRQNFPHHKRNNNNNNLFTLFVHLSKNYHNGEIVQADVKVEEVVEDTERLLQLYM
ncbi:hypothetical protein HPULCUR_003408 [Helicostylum pulchrum]|uniref:Uncharacterized protein n=1 Tax=Helicostylum pulchrum TaxID=562976 RepID=A0ABP9XUN1_9FUNG